MGPARAEVGLALALSVVSSSVRLFFSLALSSSPVLDRCVGVGVFSLFSFPLFAFPVLCPG